MSTSSDDRMPREIEFGASGHPEPVAPSPERNARHDRHAVAREGMKTNGRADAPATSERGPWTITRRELLWTGGMFGLTGAMCRLGGSPALAGTGASADADLHAAVAARGAQAADPRGDRPRNIIFMVTDGMSSGVPAITEAFARLVHGEDFRTNWLQLARMPGVVHGMLDMASLNSLVTDSAAASSSWGCGSRVFNGAVNTLPDGTSLTTLAELAKSTRRTVGLVTTTQITHATPAGFATSVPSRGRHADIARQYRDRVDVLLGGGVEYFDPALREDGHDLLTDYRMSGYRVVQHRDELLAIRPDRGRGDRLTRLLGVFGRGHLPYTIDHRADSSLAGRVPTLAEMTQAALTHLGDHADGFLLQVEGGRIDHAAHANDAAGLLWDQLAFDDALATVLRYVADHPDTLLIVTTDHGNANPGLNGMGSRYEESARCFSRVLESARSFEAVWGELRRADDADAARLIVRGFTGIEIDAGEAGAIASVNRRELEGEFNRQHRNLEGVLGQVLGNYTGIQWTGVSHTADWCPLMASGPGSSTFGGLLRNTEVFERLTTLMGCPWRNPALSAAEVHRFASAEDQGVRPVFATMAAERGLG